jgi:hypothetical protein
LDIELQKRFVKRIYKFVNDLLSYIIRLNSGYS